MTPDGPSDEQLAQWLDEYLHEVQQGRWDAARQLARQHPELATWVDCLHVLDQIRFATPLEPDAVDHDRTVTLSDTAPPEDSWSAEQVTDEFPKPFAHYQLLEELGRGGMGVVFRAYEPRLDREVAVKMILGSQLVDPSLIARFQVEARAAAQLQHANIVSIHEVGQHNGIHYFCMDYIKGESLADVIKRGPVDAEKAATILCKIACAVDYLHHKGVVHRDLKPSNILIDESGDPHVTDFGLAKLHASDSHLTKTGTIAGTPSYMAPEQAAGRTKEVGICSDIYSLGVILYELLTGQPPFREETPLDTLVQVLEGEPIAPRSLNSSVPADLERICLHCLEKSPENRYASAAELAADLERFLKGEELCIADRHFGRRLRGWARQQPALASRLSAFGLFILILEVNYRLTLAPEYLGYHLTVIGVLAIGIVGSLYFQRLLDSPRWSEWGRGGWALFDLALSTCALIVVVKNDYLSGPLLIVYPLLVAGSGLWFREQIVGLMTAGSLLSYALLLVVSRDPIDRLHHHILYAIGLAVLGFMVGYQVKRVRALSRFYERRRLP